MDKGGSAVHKEQSGDPSLNAGMAVLDPVPVGVNPCSPLGGGLEQAVDEAPSLRPSI